jgi:type I restriction enzyme R subunit
MAEAQFEKALISKLESIGWTYRKDLSNVDAKKLIDNWRNVLYQNNKDKLNGPLSDNEFSQALNVIMSTRTVYETQMLLVGTGGVGSIQITLDNGDLCDLEIFRQDNVAGGTSSYEVVNQVRFTELSRALTSKRIIDVLLLINGLPVAHIELKDENLQSQWTAFEQLRGYTGDGMYKGFYNFVQVSFIMSQHSGHYFARPDQPDDFNRAFVFGWRDANGNDVTEYNAFADEMLGIPALHRLITNNIIADGLNKKTMVMRSYQIGATRAIMSRLRTIQESGENVQHGGYIWHTTGSGKTVTSFKVAQMIASKSFIKNVIFVVDRVDLVDQTYDNFKDFSYEHLVDRVVKSSGKSLKHKLKNGRNIVVMSLQGLDAAVKRGLTSDDRMVIIMDEAHRSAEGDMVASIKHALPNTTWFGFTGTPNFYSSDELNVQTSRIISTQDIFGPRLHSYTIKDAIGDKNVLGFDVSYMDVSYDGSQVPFEIDDSIKYTNAKYREAIVDDIASNWDKQSGALVDNVREKNVFHGMLATTGKESAAALYRLFKRKHPELNVVLTYSTSNDNNGRVLDEELKRAIEDYVEKYNVHGILNAKYMAKAYLQDIVKRLAHKGNYSADGTQYIDLVIVSDQLLTGFDSKYVNIIYLDKIMREGPLIQAMSRTNRIFDARRKPYGKVRFYRDPDQMRENVKTALRIYTLGGNDTQDDISEAVVDVEQLEDDLILARPLSVEIKALAETLDRLRELSGVDFSFNPKSEKDKKEFVQIGVMVMDKLMELEQRGYELGSPVTNESTGEVVTLNINDNEFGALKARIHDVNQDLPEINQVDLTDISLAIQQVAEEVIDYDKLCELFNVYLAERTETNRTAITDHAETLPDSEAREVNKILDKIDSGQITDKRFTVETLNEHRRKIHEDDVELAIRKWLDTENVLMHKFNISYNEFKPIYDMYKPGLSKNENNESDRALSVVLDSEGVTNYTTRIKLRADLFSLFDSL